VPGEHRALLNDNRVHRILSFFLKVPPHDELYDPYTDCILLPTRDEIEAEMQRMSLGGKRTIATGSVGAWRVHTCTVGGKAVP